MKLVLLLTTLFLFSGCSNMSVTQKISANIAWSQVTARYIAEGNVSVRKARVVEVVDKIAVFVEGNPEAPISTLKEVINVTVDWSKVPTADRLLINTLIDAGLARIENEKLKGRIPEGSRMRVSEILDIVKQTALQY